MVAPRFSPLFALLAGLGVSSAALPVAFAEPSASEITVARRLFDEGKAAEDTGRFREAADKFRQAIAIKDTPGLRFHLARTQEEQGAFVEALVEYDRARELIDSGVKAADVERLLGGAREKVKNKVAQLTVRLPADVPEPKVELDGRALSPTVLGVAMPINPGKHELKASAAGRKSFATEIELGLGEAKQLPVELPLSPQAQTTLAVPAPVVTTKTPKLPDDTNGTDSARAFVLAGEASLFAAALTTGIVFSIARGGASDRYQTANEQVLSQVGGTDAEGNACGSPRPGCAELEQARRDRSRDTLLATTGFVAAGASAAAFVLTLVLWRGHEAPAKVQAQGGPGSATLSVSGHF